ncbi:MFS family permease [Paraburkholderia bryophila]|uniref:MFS family permease n=1 Tax=Paraburkholderia bryophila TaxID=420952 RepID=A0A7Y9WAQ4_9BURK|nr:MFS family permease [Paraburkholderia bryophila]
MSAPPTAAVHEKPAAVVETDLPSRLDRLPWGRFHSLIVVALGVTWLLDGLEVTLAGAVASALKSSPSLHFSNADVGLAGSAYIAGAVLGALGFGWLTDRLGRRKLFFITLALYLAATAATALSWNLASFLLFRFLTGAGIGGEYTAINSTIQEFTPAPRARLDRSRHQRHVLGGRGARRGRLAGAARSASAAGGLGLARVLLYRRGVGAGHFADAHLGARKSALAADARRRARRTLDRRRHRSALSPRGA